MKISLFPNLFHLCLCLAIALFTTSAPAARNICADNHKKILELAGFQKNSVLTEGSEKKVITQAEIEKSFQPVLKQLLEGAEVKPTELVYKEFSQKYEQLRVLTLKMTELYRSKMTPEKIREEQLKLKIESARIKEELQAYSKKNNIDGSCYNGTNCYILRVNNALVQKIFLNNSPDQLDAATAMGYVSEEPRDSLLREIGFRYVAVPPDKLFVSPTKKDTLTVFSFPDLTLSSLAKAERDKGLVFGKIKAIDRKIAEFSERLSNSLEAAKKTSLTATIEGLRTEKAEQTQILAKISEPKRIVKVSSHSSDLGLKGFTITYDSGAMDAFQCNHVGELVGTPDLKCGFPDQLNDLQRNVCSLYKVNTPAAAPASVTSPPQRGPEEINLKY